MRAGLRAVMVAVLAAVLLQAGAAAAASPPFAIDTFSETLQPGESFTVTGFGCPSTGTLPTSEALVLRLTPPTGGNAWGPQLLDGHVIILGTLAYVPGETDVSVMPNSDATFETRITIPPDAPPGNGYTVRGICTTVLEAGPGPGGFTQASFDGSDAQAGTLAVVGVPAPSPPPPLVIPPTFTG